jgi:hypothetical protein
MPMIGIYKLEKVAYLQKMKPEFMNKTYLGFSAK